MRCGAVLENTDVLLGLVRLSVTHLGQMDRGLFLSEGFFFFFLASCREPGDSFLFVGVDLWSPKMPKPKSWMLVPDFFFWCNG